MRSEVLEAFDNKHPENDYWVRFNCPEVHKSVSHYRTTGLCRNTYQLHSEVKMVESKSLKLYLSASAIMELFMRIV